ncbi:hypothetical protein PVAND_012887 [Polypedilum vanderplanki]|uniref:G-protein coupled receptors family 1 profile domain-containing protein n=1 Tax=Polypedilum vanderplanki TaxID=319348 RepID=A0A9J6CPU5_POLVA|nr:hypothetical protein PVAND_012887 [Polypedilum vanderplanki]
MDDNITYIEEDTFSELDYNSDPLLRIIASILLFILVLFGVFGNLALIHIIANKWRIQTSFNLFIANIALADILITVAMTSFLLSHMFFGEFIYGEIVCKIIVFLNYFGPNLTTFSIIMALVVLQFEVIGFKYSSIAIGITYIISSPVGVLYANFAKIIKIDANSESESVQIEHCIEDFPNYETQINVEYFGNFFIIVLPIICLIFYFFLKTLSKCTKYKILPGFPQEKLIVLLAILNTFVWILMLEIGFLSQVLETSIYLLLFIAHTTIGFSIILKPILYALLHEGFKKELKVIVGWKTNAVDRAQLF